MCFLSVGYVHTVYPSSHVNLEARAAPSVGSQCHLWRVFHTHLLSIHMLKEFT